MPVATDRDKHVIKPRVAKTPTSTPNAIGKVLTKFEASLAHGFTGHYNASGCEWLLYISQAQHKTELHPVLLRVVTLLTLYPF